MYIFPLFCYFASLSRSNTCQPRKSSKKKKSALNLKNGRRKSERATNQFYDKATPVPHFLASFRNSEFKYQIFTVMGISSRGGAWWGKKGISTFIAQDPGYLLSASSDTLHRIYFLFSLLILNCVYSEMP